jgi:hypothetical protein
MADAYLLVSPEQVGGHAEVAGRDSVVIVTPRSEVLVKVDLHARRVNSIDVGAADRRRVLVESLYRGAEFGE